MNRDIPVSAHDDRVFVSEKMSQLAISSDAEKMSPISSDASEIARLRADVARLEDDSAIEQETIDDLLNKLMTSGDELALAQKLLAEKEDECVALRASLDELKRQNAQPQPPQTNTSHDTMVAGLRQQISDLVACLDERDKTIAAADAKLADERNERAILARDLQVSVRDRQALTAQAVQGEDSTTVRELQDNLQGFKVNSEQLAEELRAMEAQYLQLKDDLGIAKRDLDDEKSANLALKMQANII